MNAWFAEGHFAKNFCAIGFHPVEVDASHTSGVPDAKIFAGRYQGEGPDLPRAHQAPE